MNKNIKSKVWVKVIKKKPQWFIAFKNNWFCDMFDYFEIETNQTFRDKVIAVEKIMQSDAILQWFDFVCIVDVGGGFIKANGSEFFAFFQTKQDVFKYLGVMLNSNKINISKFRKEEIERWILDSKCYLLFE